MLEKYFETVVTRFTESLACFISLYVIRTVKTALFDFYLEKKLIA